MTADAGSAFEVGATAQRSWTVEAEHLAPAHGSGTADVLATPALLAFCEETARSIVDPLLPERQATVGTFLEFRHTAATPPGVRVTVTARLVDVDGQRLRFELTAHDPFEEIGRGTHERFLVDSDRFLTKVSRKAKSDGN